MASGGKVKAQSWSGVLSPKQLSGRVIWTLVVVLSGSLLAAGFGPAIFSSSPADDQAAAPAVSTAEDIGPAAPLLIAVEQSGLTVTASIPNYRGNLDWRYRIINVGESCFSRVFDAAPNHPEVIRSNRLTIPSDPDRQDFWRNRWLCFQAVDQLDRRYHAVFNIDLGNPVISVRSEERDGRDYLRIYSNEDSNSYLFVSWEPLGMGAAAGDYPVAGSYCERVFVAPRALAYANFFSDVQTVDGDLIRAGENKAHCLEATDADGNRTYVHAGSESAGRIHVSQWKDRLYAAFTGSSSRIDWVAKGTLGSSLCDESVFQNLGFSDYITPQLETRIESYDSVILPLGEEAVHGHHYCFRVNDPFGYQAYRTFEIDLLPPELELQISSGGPLSTITAGGSGDILNVWFVGPTADGQLASFGCSEAFFAQDLHPENPLKYGRRATFSPRADSGKFYCFEARDRAGNSAFQGYRIP